MSSCASGRPLPVGGLPGSQTIEGGGQIRVTSAGFTKLASFIPGLLNSALAGGFCKGPQDIGNVNFCSRIVPGACGGQPGCQINVSLVPGSVHLSGQGSGTLHIDASVALEARAYAKAKFGLFKIECTNLRLHSDGIPIGADIETTIAAATGELGVRIARVTNFDVGAIQLSDCDIIADIADVFKDVFSPQLSKAAIAALTPLLQNGFQKFIPEPLGLEGVADVSHLIGANATGPALLETRLVAGGYAGFAGNGVNLGFIVGINSDADPTTRGKDANNVSLASEPNRCVPPISAPNLGAPPHMLATVTRSAITNGPVFALAPAGEFSGAPEATGDLAVGVSETALNLFGHHFVTSGALCLTIGTGPSFPNLNIGAFNVILPSVAALETKDGNDPIMLIGRPQRAIGFKVGDNTMDSPALTAQISHLEIDLYAFLYERYVRLLTVDLSADIGINLEFEAAPGGNAAIKPMLVGVTGDSIKVEVLNSDFVKETPDEIKAILPSVLEIALQKVANIEPIGLPSFVGFSLSDLSLHRVVTAQDSFLAIGATLRSGAVARELAAHDPFAADAVAALDAQARAPQPISTGKARLVDVTTPAAAQIRDALARTTGAALPSVTFDVDQFDHRGAGGRELEWSWNINGGMWHPFHSGSPLVISDAAFALQGKYTIGLQSRVKGDYTTVSEVIETPVVIDSVGPRIFADQAAWNNGDLVVPVRDAVGGKDVQVGFGSPGADVPATDWTHEADASLPRAAFDQLQVGGEVAVFARDALGNETVELVTPVRDSPHASGCACQSGGRPRAGAIALIAIVGAVVLRRRRRRDTKLAWNRPTGSHSDAN